MKKFLLFFGIIFSLMFSNTVFAATSLGFDEMYSGWFGGALILSDKLKSLEGQDVTVTGYMAPPLTPTIRFFVLTEVPMSVCPFCSSDADWPDNIIVVKVDDPVTALPYDAPISVTGSLEIGSESDEETGFVSQLRIRARDISTL
ncbi:MAG: hypothetical protein E7C72_05390 [Dialister sp.]|nr:hypothetical protein [Dialister sp.]